MKKNKKVIIIIVCVIILSIGALCYKKYNDSKKITHEEAVKNVKLSISSINQSNIDDDIKEKLNEEKNDLQNAIVTVNPYGISPLSAIISFISNETGKVTVTVYGKNNNNLVKSYDLGKENYIPVYGLYAGYNNRVNLTTSNGTSKDFYIETDKIYINNATINRASDKISNDDFYFITSPINMCSYMIDKYGEIRFFASEYYHDTVLLDNGHFLIGGNNFVTESLVSDIYEIDLLGKVYKTYNIENGYLNVIYRKDDGNLILASKNSDRNTYSDYIIEVDSKTGREIKHWDILKTLKDIDDNYLTNIDNNYFFCSGISLDKESNTLVLTYWAGEMVIALDYTSGNLKWIFSNPNNFTNKFNDYLLKLDNNEYPKSMHSATLSKGVLKVFDNGYSTNSKNTNSRSVIGAYSSANTYTISGKNISLVSSFNEDKKLFSYALADYNVLSQNSELILFGREFENFDLESDKNINEHFNLSSRIYELNNGEIEFDAKINHAALSLDKINISAINYDINKKLVEYSTLSDSRNNLVTKDLLKLIKETEQEVPYRIGFDNNILVIDRYYMDFEKANVILLDGHNNGYMYVYKEENKPAVSKLKINLPKGKYYVYIYEGEQMYKTDSFIEIN